MRTPTDEHQVTSWYIRQGEVGLQGPLSYDELRQLVQAGHLTRHQEVSTDGVEWQPACLIPDLFESQTDRVRRSVKGQVGNDDEWSPTMSPMLPGARPPTPEQSAWDRSRSSIYNGYGTSTSHTSSDEIPTTRRVRRRREVAAESEPATDAHSRMAEAIKRRAQNPAPTTSTYRRRDESGSGAHVTQQTPTANPVPPPPPPPTNASPAPARSLREPPTDEFRPSTDRFARPAATGHQTTTSITRRGSGEVAHRQTTTSRVRPATSRIQVESTESDNKGAVLLFGMVAVVLIAVLAYFAMETMKVDPLVGRWANNQPIDGATAMNLEMTFEDNGMLAITGDFQVEDESDTFSYMMTWSRRGNVITAELQQWIIEPQLIDKDLFWQHLSSSGGYRFSVESLQGATLVISDESGDRMELRRLPDH